MNVVDSSCWLEYFAGTPAGDAVGAAVEDTENLIVPSITLYEVFKKILAERDENGALLAVAHMKQGKVVALDADSAIDAARIGREYKLPMADSIIFACALQYRCTLWTQDSHFRGLPNVEYLAKA